MYFKSASENTVITSFSLTLVLFGLLVFPSIPFVTSLNSRLTDTLFILRSQTSPVEMRDKDDIVVIGVDDESYRRLNRAWPWRREVFAIFLETLLEYKPKVVGLDLTFVGKGAYPEDDQWLSDALKKSGNIVIASYFGTEGGYIEPLEQFKQSAFACGFVDKILDKDFVHRRSRFITTFRDRHKPVYSFAAETACRFRQIETRQCLEERGITDSEPHTLSYRYAPEHFSYIPLWKALMKGFPKKALENKILLVGAVSPIFHDIHNTPLGYIAGIYVNANETLMLLQKDFVAPLFSGWRMKLFLLVLTMAVSLIFYRVSVVTQLVVLLLELIGSYLTGWVFLSRFNLLLDPLPLMAVCLSSYIVCASYQRLASFSENIRLQKMVITDGLTGLYGQRYLSLRVAKEFEHAKKTGQEVCYTMLDIDHFKQINDRYGHEEGNAVLISLARTIKKNVRGMDVAARYGGDEFAVLFINCPLEKAEEAVTKIKRAFEEQSFISAKEGSFRAALSAGICSSLTKEVQSGEDLVRFADQALYQSKSLGRSRITLYKPGTSL